MTSKELKNKLELTDEEFVAYNKYTKADVYFAFVNEAKARVKLNLEVRRLKVYIAGLEYDKKKMDEEKLEEILEYYKDNFNMTEAVDFVKADLIKNNVEIKGSSFYCPIWSEETQMWLLAAGTKDKADLWVLKKIIKLIKTGDTIISVLNGNSEYLISKLKRYNVEVIDVGESNVTSIIFNKKGEI